MPPKPEVEDAGPELEPLGPQHAAAMFAVLAEPALYRFLDYGPPPSVEYLHELYSRLARGAPRDSGQAWINWVILDRGTPAGYVQATVVPSKAEAWIAYVLGTAHQGRGLATRACRALIEHVEREHGVSRWLATVEHDNAPSIALLERLGMRPARDDEAAARELTASERLYLAPPAP